QGPGERASDLALLGLRIVADGQPRPLRSGRDRARREGPAAAPGGPTADAALRACVAGAPVRELRGEHRHARAEVAAAFACPSSEGMNAPIQRACVRSSSEQSL